MNQLQVQNKLKPAAGRLLLAEPFMPDAPLGMIVHGWILRRTLAKH